MKPLVSIIIPTRNRINVLAKTLEALLLAVKTIPTEIIIVNDSEEELKIKPDNAVKIIRNPKTGAASARNAGADQSQGEIFVFLDDDMILSENVLQELLILTQNNTRSIYLPNWVYPAELRSRLLQNKFGRFLEKINYTSLEGWLDGAVVWNTETIIKHKGVASYCFMIKKADFKELGGYNEHFPFAGFEDYDLTERLKKMGFEFYIHPKLIIYHNETDRVSLKGWLERKRRGATTQRKALELGYKELEIKYSPYTKYGLYFYSFFHPVILFFCNLIPNDFIYSFFVKTLVKSYIFMGYTSDYEKNKS